MRAHTDMNVVQTGDGHFVEVQGTAEHIPFNRDELCALLDLAAKGNTELAALQRERWPVQHKSRSPSQPTTTPGRRPRE